MTNPKMYLIPSENPMTDPPKMKRIVQPRKPREANPAKEELARQKREDRSVRNISNARRGGFQ